MSDMTDEEKTLRLAHITEMFIGHGQSPPPERLKYYGNLTQYVPIEIFKRACEYAAQRCGTGFPPSVGQIIGAAHVISEGKEPDEDGYLPAPTWLIEMRTARKRREYPRELGPRTGGGPPDLELDFQSAAAGEKPEE